MPGKTQSGQFFNRIAVPARWVRYDHMRKYVSVKSFRDTSVSVWRFGANAIDGAFFGEQAGMALTYRTLPDN
ncbi:hypothetical protein CYK37_00950 [Mesorhizobium loti]|nr:hypothetical protein CYK37_00950 [Mesorhizobium loti]